jgi:hypothetical protein
MERKGENKKCPKKVQRCKKKQMIRNARERGGKQKKIQKERK